MAAHTPAGEPPKRSTLRSLGERASQVARRLTTRSSSNFKFAFLFLNPAQREGLTHVYEFCRIVDDIVDERPPGPEGRAEAERGLAEWSAEIDRIYAANALPTTEFGQQLAATIETFALPRYGFDEIIAGCAMDLDITTYADRDALELYCYRVASCVGILCIGIFGDQSEAAQRYAKHLGLALQYTNILRDVGEDAARGRVYLPHDLLTKHGLAEQDVLDCRYDGRFLAMACDFADIAESEYQLAWAELATIAKPRPLLPAEIMGRTYHELLREIRAHDYNVFTHRAALRRRDKLRVAGIALALTASPVTLPSRLRAALAT